MLKLLLANPMALKNHPMVEQKVQRTKTNSPSLTCSVLSKPCFQFMPLLHMYICGRSKRGRESLSSQEGSSKMKKAKVTDNGETDTLEDVPTKE